MDFAVSKEYKAIFELSGASATDSAPPHSVQAETVAIQFERNEWEQIEGLKEPRPDEPWGGVSGGPVFAMYEGPPVHWAAIAVITEFSQDFEIIFGCMLSEIQPDGTFGSP